jgi:hypothetical protein
MVTTLTYTSAIEYICSTRGNWSWVGDGAGDHLAADSITGIIKQQNIIEGVWES